MPDQEYVNGEVLSKVSILYGRPDIIKIVSGSDHYLIKCCGLLQTDKPFYINKAVLDNKYKTQTTLFGIELKVARKMWVDKHIKQDGNL